MYYVRTRDRELTVPDRRTLAALVDQGEIEPDAPVFDDSTHSMTTAAEALAAAPPEAPPAGGPPTAPSPEAKAPPPAPETAPPPEVKAPPPTPKVEPPPVKKKGKAPSTPPGPKPSAAQRRRQAAADRAAAGAAAATSSRLELKARFTFLALTQMLSTVVAAAVLPLLYFTNWGKKIDEPVLQYALGYALIALAVLLTTFAVGSIFHALSVQDGRLVLRRWWRNKAVELRNCRNVQWTYDSPTTTKSAVPQFHVILTVDDGGREKRVIWRLGMAWKMTEMERFIVAVRRSIGLPASGAEGQIRKSFAEIAGA